MKDDTPLTEVAHHLPASSAAHLGEFPSKVQFAVLEAIRASVVFLEESDVRLDPTQYSAVLAAQVAMVTPAYHELFKTREALERARLALNSPDLEQEAPSWHST